MNEYSFITLIFPSPKRNIQSSCLQWLWFDGVRWQVTPGVQFQWTVRSIKCWSFRITVVFECVLQLDGYKFLEHADMHLILNETHGNVAVAVKLYGYKHPDCRLPKPWTFQATDRHIRKTSTVRPTTIDAKYKAWILNVEERILRRVDWIPVSAFVEYKQLNIDYTRQCGGFSNNCCCTRTIFNWYKL
jgi:hypothetical protein